MLKYETLRVDTDYCFYLDFYHPYKRGRYKNSHFESSVFSKDILQLESGNLQIVDYFFKELKNSGLKKCILKEFNIEVICNVPSSDVSKKNSGIKQLATDLARYYKLIDGTDYLVRTSTIPKLSKGGDRSIEIHFNSIECCGDVENKNILLMDDIKTTGQSLEACKQILEDCNAKTVILLVLGKTASYRYKWYN